METREVGGENCAFYAPRRRMVAATQRRARCAGVWSATRRDGDASFRCSRSKPRIALRRCHMAWRQRLLDVYPIGASPCLRPLPAKIY